VHVTVAGGQYIDERQHAHERGLGRDTGATTKENEMSLIDQIKADREAGTPGPWAYEAHGDTMQYGVGVCHALSDIEMAFPLSGQVDSDVMVTDPVCVEVNCQTNARRIARVPDMEAALLAAVEMEKVLTSHQLWGCSVCGGDCASANPPIQSCPMRETHDALAAFRTAIGAEE
jgi:rubrerythrin